MPLSQSERQVDELAVAGVLKNHCAMFGFWKSPEKPRFQEQERQQHTDVSEQRGHGPGHDEDDATPSSRIPMPPSQRAMNSGLGARILGRSNVTAQSCAASATLPPMAPVFHPISLQPQPTLPRVPRAGRRPSRLLGVLLHAIVNAHEAGEPATNAPTIVNKGRV